MTVRTRLWRVLAGGLIVGGLLAGLFTITLPAIHRWGASDGELALALPGDEVLTHPLIRWTHAETINAPPEQVWPWIAQLGDTRAGYYSYTFIENRVGALTGADNYAVTYINADRIHPEWQNPQPGDQMIQSVLKIRAVKPGAYLLADAVKPEAFNWLWLWQLQPVDGGQHTRLIVRFGIQLPVAVSNPVMTFVMDIGGFVMEQNMLQGIKTRAEGGTEPAWTEPAEIGLWAVALLAGLAAAVLFVFKPGWQRPLIVSAAAVVALFVLTFVQPALWLRGLLDAGLLAALVWAWWQTRQQRPLVIGRASAAIYHPS